MRVVDFRIEPYDVYIGRPSPWGNPIRLTRDTLQERKRVLREYAEYLLGNPDLIERIRSELRGKTLGCWCAPRLCHGDIMVLVANAEDPYEALRIWLGNPEEVPEDIPTLF